MNVALACQLLGLEPGCSREAVASAYRRQSRDVHPDRNPAYVETFRALTEARDFLLSVDQGSLVKTLIDGAVTSTETSDRVTGQAVGCTITMSELLSVRAGRPVQKTIRYTRRMNCSACDGRRHAGGRLTDCTPCRLGANRSTCTECFGTLSVVMPVRARCPACRGSGLSDRNRITGMTLEIDRLPEDVDRWLMRVDGAGERGEACTVVFQAETEASFGSVDVRRVLGSSLHVVGVGVPLEVFLFGGCVSVPELDIRFRLPAGADCKSILCTTDGQSGLGRGNLYLDLTPILPVVDGPSITLHQPDDQSNAPLADGKISMEDFARTLLSEV